MRSWHDYHLVGYSVDGETQRITLKVVWPYETTTDILSASIEFSGVEGYFLEHDLGGNIIFSIEICPLKPFLAENATFFEREQKWGWPLFWKGSIEATSQYLESKQAQLWELSTSYGLSGWLLAKGEPKCVRRRTLRLGADAKKVVRARRRALRPIPHWGE